MNCHSYAYIFALVIWQLLEFYLGRQKRVQAGSTLELVFVLTIAAVIFMAAKIKGERK